ncbi:uncharacterized protein LOC124531730 [Vanessa cardui]|uniref:uncharacterized protein LOC124531730 n=1 Tax=Vanessa cardui TaxID=171605 RepID=UPI001F135467|nr:uncharacterized protein LOC124531730 [Vanessa cardui]
MPKRKRKDSDEYLLRKIKKLERKIQKRTRRLSSDSSSDKSNTELTLHEDNQPDVSPDVPAIIDSIDDTMSVIQSSPAEVGLDQPITENISDIPSTSEAHSETPVVLDNNILELLDETPSKSKKWEHIATTSLSKEIKRDLLEKYFLAENCLKIGSPQLNPEIKAALSDILLKKDKAIELKQKQQAIAITCIGQALTTIFSSQNKDSGVIKLLLDAARLLCDSQYIESMSRRSFVTSTIKKEIKDHLYSTEIDSFLFGEKLAETLKIARASADTPIEEVRCTAGRLAAFYDRWRLITNDPVILSWVKNGYKIPFSTIVKQEFIPSCKNVSQKEHNEFQVVINDLLNSGSISECTPCNMQYISSIFLVPKPNGKKRFILNLKSLNKFTLTNHFKMEDLRTTLKLLSKNSYVQLI